MDSIIRRLNIPNLFEVHPGWTTKWPRKKKEWHQTTIGEVRSLLRRLGLDVKQCGATEDTVKAVQDLEGGTFSMAQVPYFSLLLREAELHPRRHEMTKKEFNAALEQKPCESPVLVRIMKSPPKGYDEDIWGPFPKNGLYVVCFRLPSQNHK